MGLCSSARYRVLVLGGCSHRLRPDTEDMPRMKLRLLPTRVGVALKLGDVETHLSSDMCETAGLHPPGVVNLDVQARTTEGMITTDDMYELHPAGTVLEFKGEVFTVDDDGLWRNKLGMEPAGQSVPPPDPPKHCKGCRCDEPQPPRGRMSHGGVL